MGAKAKKPNSRDLNQRQLKAIDLRAAGQSRVAAARAAGVDRKTLYLWETRSPAFQAELNSRRREFLEIQRAKLLAALPRAVEVYTDKVEEGDFKASAQLLKELGAFTPPPIGSEDPYEIELQMRYEGMRKQSDQNGVVRKASQVVFLEMMLKRLGLDEQPVLDIVDAIRKRARGPGPTEADAENENEDEPNGSER